MKEEVLTIHVALTGTQTVLGGRGSACMIAFTGTAEGPQFRGRILPGGVDTQIEQQGRRTLSARYLLEGTDDAGNRCKVFIENNGAVLPEEASICTTPTILTDSPRLQWLESATLSGTVEADGKDRVLIHIYAEEM